MARCVCELLGDRLQPHAHAFHQGIEEAIQQVVVLAPKYLAALRRSKRQDPQVEEIFARTQMRLQQIHHAAQKHLPAPHPLSETWNSRDSSRQRLNVRREEDGQV
jgi:predicted ATPase